ncbi:hypothetical protein [Crocinitomix catalasitica]|uniref:hypothetical protein n=1 Tax=Crocinitomix catalasitica TaxID=184607 RepID=UPI0004817131|nr:hypothetical protein [Crocinitomix catalasitica]
MKKFVLVSLLVLSIIPSFADELPKNCFGKYGGEMPAYFVMLDGSEIKIDRHDVYLTLSEGKLIYTAGTIELSGTYTALKQGKNEYVVKCILSNGRSLEYELNLIYFKEEQKIYLSPNNGQSAANLERIDG